MVHANTVVPDHMYVSAARRHIVTDRARAAIPDLAVEILSPSNSPHDLRVKRELYAHHTLPEYWRIDPYRETVLAVTDPIVNDGVGEYTTETLRPSGDTLATTRSAGLAIAEADTCTTPR